MTFKFKYFFFLSLFFSCSDPKLESANRLSPIKKVISINDTIFFGTSEQIVFEDNIIINDHKRSKIYFTDSKLNSIRMSFGIQGRGPGEIGFSNSIRINQGMLHVLDDLNHRIHRFEISTGKFLGATKIQTRMHILSKFIAFNDSYVTINNYDSDKPIVVSDWNGDIKLRFGDFYNFEGQNSIARNHRILHDLDNQYIVSLFVSDPIIEVHDKEGNLLNSQRIDIPEVIQSHKVVLEDYEKQNNSNYISTLFKEMIVSENNIYILFFDKSTEKLSNKIIVMDKRSLLNLPSVNRIIEISDGENVPMYGGMFPFDHESKMVIQNIVSGHLLLIEL